MKLGRSSEYQPMLAPESVSNQRMRQQWNIVKTIGICIVVIIGVALLLLGKSISSQTNKQTSIDMRNAGKPPIILTHPNNNNHNHNTDNNNNHNKNNNNDDKSNNKSYKDMIMDKINDYIGLNTESEDEEQEEEAPSHGHIEHFHLINKLEFTDINGNSETCKPNFDQLTPLKDPGSFQVWPMPQHMSMFEETATIYEPIEFESNVDNSIIEKAIERYRNIIFDHRTNQDYTKLQSNSLQKVIIYINPNINNNADATPETAADGAAAVAANGNENANNENVNANNNNNDENNKDNNNNNDQNSDNNNNKNNNDINNIEDEHYELVIHNPTNGDCHEILLSSRTIVGALRGLETLSQLIHYSFDDDLYKINIGLIKDYPRFEHRGILLDTSRHFHPISVIKHFLLSLSFSKFNVFHWHIVDQESFPIQSIKYPKLWQGAYSNVEKYSLNDIKDIITYATELGIRVIPEFDTPGHAKSWCKGYPELCIDFTCSGPFPTVLDPTNQNTFEFIENLFLEMTDSNNGLFFDKLFHLGSDEVNHHCYMSIEKVKKWMNLPENNKFIKESKHIYGYFVNKTQTIVLNKLHKNPIVWNEVYDNFHGNKNFLNKNTIIQLWQGGEKQKRNEIIQNGHKYIISYSWYLDHIGNSLNSIYSEDPINGVNNIDMTIVKKHAIGGEACMWSEQIDFSDLDATVWPKAALVAERLWSNENVKNFEQAEKRLHYFRCMLIRRGIGAAPVNNPQSRQPPPHQDSCLKQRI